MKIEVIEIAGFAPALKALRLPYGKEERSESEAFYRAGKRSIINKEKITLLHPDDLTLLSALVKRGDEHAKVLRGVMVWMKITAPVYLWAEIETYRTGHERLCSESTMHIDCKGLSGEELVKAKSEIPMGKELTKIDMFSYQCLRNIYRQRKDHRLPEWREFCKVIETLPFAEELITIGINGESL